MQRLCPLLLTALLCWWNNPTMAQSYVSTLSDTTQVRVVRQYIASHKTQTRDTDILNSKEAVIILRYEGYSYDRFIDKTIGSMLSEQPERHSTYVPERLRDSIPPLLPQRQRHYVLERFNTWNVLFQRYKAAEIRIRT